jgi:hypothetical protein
MSSNLGGVITPHVMRKAHRRIMIFRNVLIKLASIAVIKIECVVSSSFGVQGNDLNCCQLNVIDHAYNLLNPSMSTNLQFFTASCFNTFSMWSTSEVVASGLPYYLSSDWDGVFLESDPWLHKNYRWSLIFSPLFFI